MSSKRTGIFPANPVTARGVSTKLSAVKDKVIYTNGKTVIIRDLNSPLLSKTYSGHVQNATVARFSPSGYYCASADANGTVRIWDTVGEDQTLKGEYKVISGRINDLEWDGESKRIIAVGDGREKFGHAFMMDSGSSTGDINGHSKAINSVSIRHQRPFRAATAADDGLIVFHQGVPFKYDKTIKTHTKFVQDVRYAPSGDHFASVGSDAKIFLYDGKTGDTLHEFADHHKGSIMACSWGPDSKSLATSSADCTVALWDVQNQKPVTTWKLGSGVNNQQVGNAWSGERDIVSLSVSGDLNIFDPRVGDKPARILNAPQKSITTAIPTSSDTFLAGTADGRILSFSTSTGGSTNLGGAGHSNFVSGLASSPEVNNAYSVGYDDRVQEIEASGDSRAAVLNSTGTSLQPKSIAVAGDGTVFVVEVNNVIEAFRSNQRVFEQASKFTPSVVAAHKALVAIGGEDQKVRLNEWDGKLLKEVSVLEGNKGGVSALAFSPDGNLLASGDSSGRIALFDVKEKKMITSRWSFHSARINSIAWTSDSQHCASASLDTHVYIWSVAKPMKNIAIKNAAPGGANAVLWLGSNTLASAGADACVRIWEVTFHA
ncbi:putative WD repeat-containing protein C9G1.05 [Hypsizygus marmoreus]|uniref:WD repeat-containing protein C9G1.05 n=1 Tax=Hypsizygus marmoreus TaxID=39966 RepID=A0A369KGB5_HYPMA|nr:putative WD repeat-containing protein C9G1.05 [Hypsizygus marmoreus]